MIDFRALFVAILVCGFGLSACGPEKLATPPASPADARASGVAAQDNGISLEVRTRFLHEKFRYSFLDVGSSVFNGRVLLTGTVESGSERKAAFRIVRHIAGVREVINEIQVARRGHLKDPTLDVSVERVVRRRLARIAGANSRNYRWRCVNGVVYMIGIAQDRQELERVTAAARNSSRVRRVVSHVRVQ